MMTLEQRAAAHYPDSIKLQAAWLRIIRILGDKWLLAKVAERKDTK